MSIKTSYHERDHTYGEAMLKLRTAIGLTQGCLGNLLGVSGRTVGGWEAGGIYPRTDHFKKLITLAVQHQAFASGNAAEEIRLLWKMAHQKQLLDEDWLSALLSEHESPLPHMTEALVKEHTLPVIQNLPFPPNPFFTGRVTELLLISQLFEQNARIAITQPISISGLGGIGKTQLALEYAHRCHPNIYRCVFWVNAADKASLEASYLALAHLLKLVSQQEKEVDRIVQIVNIWLEEHSSWLLILDNADDLELTRSFLPTKPRGHILLTTRSQIVGDLAALLQVEVLPPEVGLLFLLRRSGVLKLSAELNTVPATLRREAEQLVELLAGHPLALDQAGAYIEETTEPLTRATQASFATYRLLYQQQSHILLKSRGSLKGLHPNSIVTTFEISFRKACELHPKCAEVLAFCALLHPDAIPEELLQQGLNMDLLLFHEVIRALRSYSLVKRDVEKQVLSLHRLVQAVIRDGMDSQTLQRWTECVVQVVNDAFPEVTFEEWKRCERYLPHALICVNPPLHEVVPPPQVPHLLMKAGTYLQERGLYTDAEPHLVRALVLREQSLGSEHPDTAKSLNRLALLYRQQSKHEQAEPLYQRAILIHEQHLGPEHPDTAHSLSNLASLYLYQGKYELAEPLYQRAILIHEQHLGPEHPGTAQSLNNLASLYYRQGKYELTEPLFKRALAIYEQHLGAEHPNTATGLHNLAALYWRLGKYALTEPLLKRALSIREQHLGTEHPDTVLNLSSLAELYQYQGKYELAEPLYQQALLIREQHLEAEHPDTAIILHGLAELYQQQGKHEQAEPLYQRALSIREQLLGAGHPDTARSLHNLAQLYQQQGKYELAEPLYQQALSIREKRLGPNHPETEVSRNGYAAFLRLTRLIKSGS